MGHQGDIGNDRASGGLSELMALEETSGTGGKSGIRGAIGNGGFSRTGEASMTEVCQV